MEAEQIAMQDAQQDKPKPLTPRRLKARELVHTTIKVATQGGTLADVAKQLPDQFPNQNVQNIASHVHNRLKTSIVQEEANLVNDYDKAKIRRLINATLDNYDAAEPLQTHVRVLEIAARSEAMLTDNMRTEIVTTDADELAEQAAKTLASLLPSKSETSEIVQNENVNAQKV